MLSHADGLSRLPLPATEVHDTTPTNAFIFEQAYPDALLPAVIKRATVRDLIMSEVAEAVLTRSPLPVGGDGGLILRGLMNLVRTKDASCHCSQVSAIPCP